MLKFFASDVMVSKGYQNAPALKFSEKGDFVRFRVGQKVYDPVQRTTTAGSTSPSSALILQSSTASVRWA